MICEVCGDGMEDEFSFCGKCLSRLIAVVRDVPDMLLTLSVTVEKRDQMGAMVGGPSFNRPLPLNHDAMVAKKDLADAFRDLFVYLHRMFPDPVGHRIADTVAFLDDYLPCVQVIPDGAHWYHRVVGAYRRAQSLADRPAERVTLGVCGKKTPIFWTVMRVCSEPLSAPVGRPTVTCRGCGTVWSVKERQADAYTAARETVAYPAVIVRALESQGIRASLVDINDWQRRSVDPLVPAEVDDRGRKLFRFSDVYRFAAAARRRKERA
jgi:hypothetical protein